ncbi:hypothetical protein F5Y19DRAFT_10500 [Xylariaceae sp. FL1651]|nr:hypothetical protein F5Y19DRAFT_10500 [Xylariaceae sp. FL1651]
MTRLVSGCMLLFPWWIYPFIALNTVFTGGHTHDRRSVFALDRRGYTEGESFCEKRDDGVKIELDMDCFYLDASLMVQRMSGQFEIIATSNLYVYVDKRWFMPRTSLNE